MEIVASVLIDEPPPVCSPPPPALSPPLADLSMPPLPNLGSSSLYGGSQGSQPFYWGGASPYSGRRGPRPRTPWMLVSSGLGLVWAGFAGGEALHRTRQQFRMLAFDEAVVWVPTTASLLLLLGQVACVAALIAAVGGAGRRYSWGPLLGFRTATASTCIAFAWVPLLSSLLGLASFVAGRATLSGRDLASFAFRAVVDLFVFIVVPSLLIVHFRGQIGSDRRDDESPALSQIMSAATLGWSASVLVSTLAFLIAVITFLEMHSESIDYNHKFWMVIGGRACTLLAGLVLAIAGIGMFCKQDWSLPTGLIAAASYIVLILVIAVGEMLSRDGSSFEVNSAVILRTVLGMIIPACICGWCLFAQDRDW
jgi:hypothetical protein